MDYVKKFRDFSRITVNDLERAFDKLRLRCPSTWNSKLEASAYDFHSKILTLREGNAEKYIDPEIHKPYETKDQNGDKDMIISPNLQNMQGKELEENFGRCFITSRFTPHLKEDRLLERGSKLCYLAFAVKSF